MALIAKHAKTSGLANPADPALVGGADWDADHAVEIADPLTPPGDGDVLTYRTATGLGFETPAASGSGLATQTITLGPGGDFTTLTALMAHLRTNGIAPDATVSVSLLSGAIADTADVDMEFAQAGQVKIYGSTSSATLQEISNIATSGTDRWTMDATFADATNIAVGDHICVFVNELSNAEMFKIGGVLLATAKVGNVVTVETFATGTIPSPVAGQSISCTVIKSIFAKNLYNVGDYNYLGGFGITGNNGGLSVSGARRSWGTISVYRAVTGTFNYHFRFSMGSAISAQLFAAGPGTGLICDYMSAVNVNGSGIAASTGVSVDALSRVFLSTSNSARSVRASGAFGAIAANGSFLLHRAGAITGATQPTYPAHSLTNMSADGAQCVAN